MPDRQSVRKNLLTMEDVAKVAECRAVRSEIGVLLCGVSQYKDKGVSMDDFIKVAKVGEIEPGEGKLFRHNGIFIAIFNSWGAYYAVEGHCTGCGAVLSECEFSGSLITCPSDAAAFYLPAGISMGPDALRRLISFRVHIDKEEIKVKPAEPEEVFDDVCSIENSMDLDDVPMGRA